MANNYNNSNNNYYSIPSTPTTGKMSSITYKSEDLKRLMEEIAQKTEEGAASAVQGADVMDGYENAKRMSAAVLNASQAAEAQAMLYKFNHGDGKRAAEGVDDLFFAYGIDSVAKVSMDEQRMFCRQLEIGTELGSGNSVFDGLIDERQKLVDERAKIAINDNGNDASATALRAKALDEQINQITTDIDNIKKGQQFYREELSRQIKQQYGIDVKPEDVRIATGTDFTTRGLRKNTDLSVYDVNAGVNSKMFKISTSTIATSGYKENGQTFVAKTVADAAMFSSTDYAAKKTFVDNNKKIKEFGKTDWAMRTLGVNNMTGKEIADIYQRYKVNLTYNEMQDAKKMISTDTREKIEKNSTISLAELQKNDEFGQRLAASLVNENGISLKNSFTLEDIEKLACEHKRAEIAMQRMAACKDEREQAKIAFANGIVGKDKNNLAYNTAGDVRAKTLVSWKEGPEKYFNKISKGARGTVTSLIRDASHNAQDSDVLQGFNVAKKPVQIVKKAINTKWYVQNNYHRIRSMKLQSEIKSTAANTKKRQELIAKYEKSYGRDGKWTKRLQKRQAKIQRMQARKDAIFAVPRKLTNKTIDATKNTIMASDKYHILENTRDRYLKIKNMPQNLKASRAGSYARSITKKSKAKIVSGGKKFGNSKARKVLWGRKSGARDKARTLMKKIGKKTANLAKHVAVNFMKYVGIAILFFSLSSVMGIALLGISRMNITSVISSQDWSSTGNHINSALASQLAAGDSSLEAYSAAIFSVVTDVYDVKRDNYNQTYNSAGGDSDLRAENENYEKKVWNIIASGYLDGKFLIPDSSKLNDDGIYVLNKSSKEAALVGGIMSALDTISRIDNVDKSVPFNPFLTRVIGVTNADGEETQELVVGFARVRLFDDSILTSDSADVNTDDPEEEIRQREVEWAKNINDTKFVHIKIISPEESEDGKEHVDISAVVEKDADGNVIYDENGKAVISENGGMTVADCDSGTMMVAGISGFIPLVKMADKADGGYLSRVASGAESATAEDVYNYIVGSEYIRNWYGQESIDRAYVDYVNKYGICEHPNRHDSGKTANYDPPQVIFECDDCGEEFTDGTIREVPEEPAETDGAGDDSGAENNGDASNESTAPEPSPAPSNPSNKPGKGFGEISM